MTTHTPESPPLERTFEELRQGPLQALHVLLSDLKTLVRQGEFGALPVILGLAVIWAYFEVQDQHFLTARNLVNLVLQISVTGTIAVGVVLVLLIGEIDLSIGSVAGVCAAVLGVTVANDGWPWWAGIATMLACGAAIGAFQGAWTAVIGVPSFVVTLAGLLAWLGVQLHVLGQQGTINVFSAQIGAITTTDLPHFWGWTVAVAAAAGYGLTRGFESIRRKRAQLPARRIPVVAGITLCLTALLLGVVAILNHAGGVPTAGVILLGLVIFFDWLTRRTKFGRYIFAVGGNAEAARRAGINVTGIRIAAFTLGSFLAALGGLIAVSRGASAGTLTGGGTLLLEAIAAAVIGGTSLFGGRGTIWAALLGALVIGSVSNGLDLVGQPADIKYIVEGAILLLAITVDALSRRGRTAAGR